MHGHVFVCFLLGGMRIHEDPLAVEEMCCRKCGQIVEQAQKHRLGCKSLAFSMRPNERLSIIDAAFSILFARPRPF